MSENKPCHNEDMCMPEFKEIKGKLDKLYGALFEGNGEPGLKAQVQMHGKFISGLIWLGGVLIVAIVTVAIEVHFKT